MRKFSGLQLNNNSSSEPRCQHKKSNRISSFRSRIFFNPSLKFKSSKKPIGTWCSWVFTSYDPLGFTNGKIYFCCKYFLWLQIKLEEKFDCIRNMYNNLNEKGKEHLINKTPGKKIISFYPPLCTLPLLI